MRVANVLSLLGGLALFLYGMQMMSAGLEAAAGNRMRRLLEKLTANRALGVLVGAGITAVIQSSSATTVMVVGFVNSGMMTLQQAVWIIMGANIGTTITGHLIAMDVGAMAPLFAFIGVMLVVFMKRAIFHHYGQIIAGLGILFIGMEMMSTAMLPLRESESFISLMTRFSNPVLGILAGTVFTALIQSSSASVGILQALAGSGLTSLSSAVYVLFGQNIGTCITAVLASIGTSRSAKRATMIHLMFNLIGTTVFTIACIMLPLVELVEYLTPGNVASQIANMHTLFNVTTTLLLIPFGTYLAKLSIRILPDTPEEKDEKYKLEYIKPPELAPEYQMGNSAIMIHGIRLELERMTKMVRQNVTKSFDAVLAGTTRMMEEVTETEEYLDYLNLEISQYISRMITLESNERDSARISAYFKIVGNLERVGDHAMNICEYTRILEGKDVVFSPQAREEILQMKEMTLSAVDLIRDLDVISIERFTEISAAEQKMDDMAQSFRQNQMGRMKAGTCSEEGCIIFAEMLSDFERIGDHVLNVGEELARTGFSE